MSAVSAATHPPRQSVPKQPPEKNAFQRILGIFTQTDLNPPLKNISLEELQKHNTTDDGWTILDGKVYNVTHYAKIHPGGANVFAPCLGTDGTAHFRSAHKYRKIHVLNGPEYLVGVYKQ